MERERLKRESSTMMAQRRVAFVSGRIVSWMILAARDSVNLRQFVWQEFKKR